MVDKTKINQADHKKCWGWIWNSSIETNTSIKITIKQIREEDIKAFLVKPNSTKVDVVKYLNQLIEAAGDYVKIGSETNVNCKDIYFIKSSNFSNSFNYYTYF